jgi:hypothetical protein
LKHKLKDIQQQVLNGKEIKIKLWKWKMAKGRQNRKVKQIRILGGKNIKAHTER